MHSSDTRCSHLRPHLQADLATIESPNEETFSEMYEQMCPAPPQLQKLVSANNNLQAQVHEAENRTAIARSSFENRLSQLGAAADDIDVEHEELAAENGALRAQVRLRRASLAGRRSVQHLF